MFSPPTLLPLELADLGLTTDQLATLHSILRRSTGLTLLNGPVRSGATTTLYAMLNHMRKPGLVLGTVEDPVERNLDGITQVQVNPVVGLSFAAALRALRAQAPNVILIGEIRDQETAELAVEATLEGRQVLSLVRTSNAAQVALRLVDLGVSAGDVASALAGSLAQRLVRTLCVDCRAPYELRDDDWFALGIGRGARDSAGITHLHQAHGCRACDGTGYRGQTGIFEVLEIDEELGDQIRQGASSEALEAAAVNRGILPLWQAGAAKVIAGVTTVAELRLAIS